MNISITARKFKARPTLKDFILSEVSALDKYNDSILNADVILSYTNTRENIKSAEIILKVPGHILRATEDSDEFEKSINAATEKLVRQLKKIKTRRTARVK